MKWKFWKKDEEQLPPLSAEFPAEPPAEPMPAAPTPPTDLGMPGSLPGAPPDLGIAPRPAMKPSAFHEKISDEKAHELINSKLDTLKAQLDYIIQRLDRLEKPKW